MASAGKLGKAGHRKPKIRAQKIRIRARYIIAQRGYALASSDHKMWGCPHNGKTRQVSRPWRGNFQQVSRNESLTVVVCDSSLGLLTVEAGRPVPQHVVVTGGKCIPTLHNYGSRPAMRTGRRSVPSAAWRDLRA